MIGLNFFMYGGEVFFFPGEDIDNYIFLTKAPMPFNIKFINYFYLCNLAGRKGFFSVKNFLRFINQ